MRARSLSFICPQRSSDLSSLILWQRKARRPWKKRGMASMHFSVSGTCWIVASLLLLLYPLPVYPLALFFNLVLRFTWSIKLSSHLHARALGEGSLVIFWVEVAELVRRWIWVFIRVEWEIVRRAQDGAKHSGVSGENGLDTNHESFELVTTSIDEPSL